MGYAESKVKQYKKGKKPTFLEKRMLEHADPIHFTLAIVGIAILLYGLWMRNLVAIFVGIGMNFIGHIYTWVK